jgi:hypothetical protein
MRAQALSELEGRLLRPAGPGAFGGAELEGLPAPARRHLAQAIAPGTPLAVSARLRMRGRIRVGRWLPFRAREVLSPHHGFVWAARAAGVIAGSDRYVDGAGGMDWKLAGLATVAHAEGADTSRSAAGRAAAEGMWAPTALLPRFGVRWSAEGPGEVRASWRIGEVTGYRTFGGVAIPSAGRVGWFFGTGRWAAGEFFRYRITDLELVVANA